MVFQDGRYGARTGRTGPARIVVPLSARILAARCPSELRVGEGTNRQDPCGEGTARYGFKQAHGRGFGPVEDD